MPFPINVLIIEDDPTWQKLITSSLINLGCNVSACVGNVDEVMNVLDKNDFDIALVDIYLGSQNTGLMLGKLIRQKFNKPFIFLTSVVDPKLFQLAISANCSSYITKPFSPQNLFDTIKHVLIDFNASTDTVSVNNYINTKHDFFFAKSGKHLKKVFWSDIVCLRSDRNYTQVITSNNEVYMIRGSLQKVISIIIPISLRQNFVQINRAEILQISYIEQLNDDELHIGSQTYTVTESYIKNLRLKLNIIL